MTEKFSLKDHLFNADSLSRLAGDFSRGLPHFDGDAFLQLCVPGLQGRELLDRLEWMADCLENQLAPAFPEMGNQLLAALPPPLDPTNTDDDFGNFVYAVFGILTVRHALEAHRDMGFDLLHAATQRFSMEFYIRLFINRWPDESFDRLTSWAEDENYHVRRLASEGTRARLPWAKNITTDPLRPLAILDKLHADDARFVTRSVANHLNDITKFNLLAVINRLQSWRDAGRQKPVELAWMERHALRTAIKSGAPEAMAFLGYAADPLVEMSELSLNVAEIKPGEKLEFAFDILARDDAPLIVDYVIDFVKSNRETAPKTFKLKNLEIQAGKVQKFAKKHLFKGDATTFKLYPGRHRLSIQVNGKILRSVEFTLLA